MWSKLRRRRRSIAKVTFALLAVAGALICGSIARGQAADGMLPQQITVVEADAIVGSLDFSREQREAAWMLHERYSRANSMMFEDGGSARWLLEHLHTINTGSSASSREIRAFYERRAAALRMMETLDSEFFDEIERLAAETQRQPLSALRLARERQRHGSSMVVWFARSSLVDLNIALRSLDLPLQRRGDWAEIEPLLTAYDTQLTSGGACSGGGRVRGLGCGSDLAGRDGR